MKNYNDSKIKVFISYLTNHKKDFAIDMILSGLIAVVDLIFPYASRWAMQTLLPDYAFNAFFVLMVIILLAYLFRAYFQYLVTIIGHRMGTLVEADMRRDVFTHMQSLSFSFFDKNRTGELLTRVTNDLFEIVELAHHGPENLLTCFLTIVGAVIILIRINVPLTLLLIVLLLISLMFCSRQRELMKQANVKVKEKTGEINSAIESGISGIRTSKAFANEKVEDQKFDIANEKFKLSKVGYYKAMGRFNSGVEATVGIMQVFTIALGGYFIMVNKMSYVDLITFTLYISTFVTPVRKLTQFMEIYTQGMAGFERFLSIMRTEPEIKDKKDAIVLTDVKGNIKYDNVSFSYADKDNVVEDINIDLKEGDTLALVGSSGGGKTTICNLLPRFYDVNSGNIYIDGVNIKDVTQDSLRKNIGIIQQEVFLFAGTIMDNIRYGKPNATDEEIILAAKKADIHDEIMNMENQYDTYVGERGVALSGGQKQRISIARVFLKNPQILILDEATSALDSITERQIQQSLNTLLNGKTAIIIAHRLSTIKDVKYIAVVENKHIVEFGTRKELLEKQGKYAKLEKAQEL